VVGAESTADDTIRACRESSPSLIILSLSIPSSQGMTALSAIRARESEIPILAIAERGEAHCMVLNPPQSATMAIDGPGVHCTAGADCLELAVAEGANGTIRRSAAPEELFVAIRTIASGKAWYEAGTAAAIMRHALARISGDGSPRPLSSREIEVSGLIANGRSNKEIAQALGISEPTVKKHVGHILVKLNLEDRLQLGIYFTRNPTLLRSVPGSRR
jgi:DNA-binding NarL/FixJ family response regulator